MFAVRLLLVGLLLAGCCTVPVVEAPYNPVADYVGLWDCDSDTLPDMYLNLKFNGMMEYMDYGRYVLSVIYWGGWYVDYERLYLAVTGEGLTYFEHALEDDVLRLYGPSHSYVCVQP